MTDRTEAEQNLMDLLDCVEDARIAIARALDKDDVHPVVGVIALSALHHQASINIDEEDADLVEKVSAVVIEAINEAEADQRPRPDEAIH